MTNREKNPKQGGGGVPDLGKIPTFSRFFFWGGGASLIELSKTNGIYECLQAENVSLAHFKIDFMAHI